VKTAIFEVRRQHPSIFGKIAITQTYKAETEGARDGLSLVG